MLQTLFKQINNETKQKIVFELKCLLTHHDTVPANNKLISFGASNVNQINKMNLNNITVHLFHHIHITMRIILIHVQTIELYVLK